MYYSHNVRTKLQEWKNRLYKLSASQIDNHFNFFLQYLETEKVIDGILVEAIQKHQVTQKAIEGWHTDLCLRGQSHYNFETQQQLAAYTYGLFKHFQKGKGQMYGAQTIFRGASGEDAKNRFLDRFLAPFVDYLHDVLDESNSVLYLLEKYKRRTEWFVRDALLASYRNVTNKNYEKVFEDDLRLFLFDQGIDYPFSTPSSASGRADIIGLIDTKNPLVLEIKIYDSAKGYRKQRIVDGFAQAVKYSNDYHKELAYLVVYNVDAVEIEIQTTDQSSRWPPKVYFNGKTYFIVVVNLNFEETASNTGKLQKVIIKEEELTKEAV